MGTAEYLVLLYPQLLRHGKHSVSVSSFLLGLEVFEQQVLLCFPGVGAPGAPGRMYQESISSDALMVPGGGC